VELVDEVGRGLRRVLRKYRTLAGHLLRDSDGGWTGAGYPSNEDRRQGGMSLRGESSAVDAGAPEASQAGSWAIGAGRSGGDASACSAGDPSSGVGGSAACAAMEEAGRRAASIAAKLDRLLTPQSRAAVHGGAGAGWKSRFAAAEDLSDGPPGAAAEPPNGGPAGPWPFDLGHWGIDQTDQGDPFQQQQQQQQAAWPAPAGDPEEVPLRQRYAAAPPF
jgi:hypothetical protein